MIKTTYKCNKYAFLKLFIVLIAISIILYFLAYGTKEEIKADNTPPLNSLPISLSKVDGSYIIETKDDLYSLSASVNSGTSTKGLTFVVEKKILLDDKFVSIGTKEYPFSGTFRCKDILSSICNINKPLFGYIDGATIQNVEISSGEIVDNSMYVGAFVGYSINSYIIQCGNNATVSALNDANAVYVGGIAGYVSNTIINQCLNTANVNNTSMQVKKSYVGGIAGYIDEKSSVSDCYVLGMQDTLKISAQADDKLIKTTVWEENNSVYYSTLQRANQEFQAKLQKAQDDLYNEQSKLSGIENHIRSLKSKIYEYDRQINEISARRSRYKWYQFGKRLACDLEIAGIRVIQAGLWVTVGAEEAARAVAYGAIEAFQWVVNGLVSIGSYLISDVQWIQPYDDCTRTENIKDAYAYGIGYSSGNIYNCYTAKIQCTGGYEYITYRYYLRFWGMSGEIYLTPSSKIERIVYMENIDKCGELTNSYADNSYIYEKQNEFSRIIRVDNNKNWYKSNEKYITSYDVVGDVMRFDGQKLIFESYNNIVNLSVDTRLGGAKKTVGMCKFTNEPVREKVGISCEDSKELLNEKVTNNFDTEIWAVDPIVSGGFPHLKYRYWQDQITEETEFIDNLVA